MNTTLIWAAPVSLSVAAAIAALLSFGKIKKTLHSQLRNTPKASCYRTGDSLGIVRPISSLYAFTINARLKKLCSTFH